MRVYADNAATTALSDTALKAMMPYFQTYYGNPSSLHTVGQEAAEALLRARETVARCLGAEPREMYFTSGGSEADNQALIDALFHVQPPMPADEQRETFGGVLRNALDEECSLAVVQQVRQELKDRIDAWQETKSDDPLVVSGDELKDVLEGCGVSEEKRMQFGAQFDESFGGGAVLNPRNLVDVKKCVLKTPDVSITVNPERPDLVETRVLGGVRYILIKADEGVELNGIDLADET